MKRGTAAFFIVALVSILTVPSVWSQADPDFLIIAGTAMGKYSLSWTLDQYKQELGQEFEMGSWETKTLDGSSSFTVQYFFWEKMALEVLVRPDRNNQVIGINLYRRPNNLALDEINKKYRTADGLGLYSTRAEIEQVLGRPDYEWSIQSELYISYNSGIIFGFNKNKDPNVVAMVGVWLHKGWQ